jgi:hypothetical protein
VKKSLSPIALMALMTALFVAWQVYGIDGAHNVITFWVYSCAVLGVLGLCVTPSKPMPKRGPIIRWIVAASNVATIVAFAWVGRFDFASMWAFSVITTLIYREKADRVKVTA